MTLYLPLVVSYFAGFVLDAIVVPMIVMYVLDVTSCMILDVTQIPMLTL